MLFGVLIASLFSGAASASGARAHGRSWSAGGCCSRPSSCTSLAANLTKASFRAPASKVPWLAWASAAVMMLASGAVIGSLAAHAGLLVSRPTGDALRAGLEASRSGIAAVALWPFTAVVAPMLAAHPASFARALVSALAVAAANYGWVLASDAQLEHSAAAAEQAQVKERRGLPKPVVRAAPFTLGPAGRLETAVFWKNTIQFGRYASVGVIVRVLLPVVVLAFVVGLNRKAGSIAPIVLVLAFFATLIGPYMIRNDLRDGPAEAARAEDLADRRSRAARRRTPRAVGRPLDRRLVPAGAGLRPVAWAGVRAPATHSAARLSPWRARSSRRC